MQTFEQTHILAKWQMRVPAMEMPDPARLHLKRGALLEDAFEYMSKDLHHKTFAQTGSIALSEFMFQSWSPKHKDHVLWR
jgi:hypothetical protein